MGWLGCISSEGSRGAVSPCLLKLLVAACMPWLEVLHPFDLGVHCSISLSDSEPPLYSEVLLGLYMGPINQTCKNA
jgi:hypothetical protein